MGKRENSIFLDSYIRMTKRPISCISTIPQIDVINVNFSKAVKVGTHIYLVLNKLYHIQNKFLNAFTNIKTTTTAYKYKFKHGSIR